MEANVDILEAIRGRSSIRAFLKKAVEPALIQTILETARYAPSGANTQPWKIAVLTGKTKEKLSELLLNARKENKPENPDYPYYPPIWFEPYKTRRKVCGFALYQALNIAKDDAERRMITWNHNYLFFGAPVGLIFYLDQALTKGSWVDCGMFVQNVMLAARQFSLGTCPQASLAEYPDIVRKVLNISNDYHILCGMSLGYPDLNQPVNQYRTERIPLSDFVYWFN